MGREPSEIGCLSTPKGAFTRPRREGFLVECVQSRSGQATAQHRPARPPRHLGRELFLAKGVGDQIRLSVWLFLEAGWPWSSGSRTSTTGGSAERAGGRLLRHASTRRQEWDHHAPGLAASGRPESSRSAAEKTLRNRVWRVPLRCQGLNRVLGLGLSPEDQELLFKAQSRGQSRSSQSSSAGGKFSELELQELAQKKKGAAMAWDLAIFGQAHAETALLAT